ncbi:MAG: tRNA pseudouridine(55) synthase TruB [Chloroflexi bacterium RBG_13_57_8]|nr:MAG: tRNA pseudouridine(55) synthase TruB [Chloroflexi bacterium RBG_13_57_8]
MDGILNINKPPGITSFGVVARVKRLTGERRVGHAGTLDPTASGVLPVCLGNATRIVEFLIDSGKTYRAVIELGVTTDTYDAAGQVTRHADPAGVGLPQLEQALASFRGAIKQTPPMFSALKSRGRPLYKLARAGLTIERKSRPVTIYRLDLVSWAAPLVELEIECSKGTYVRSLANDIGEALGCGAFLKELVRTRSSIFDIGDAISLDMLEEAVKSSDWPRFLHQVDSVLGGMPSVTLAEAQQADMRHGNVLNIPGTVPPGAGPGYCRAYTPEGRFLGILRYLPDSGLWHPEKVFV